jgi:hypothetical protein
MLQLVQESWPRTADDGVLYIRLHQMGDMTIPIDDMKRFFEAEYNHERVMESLDIKEWASKAEKMAMRPAIATVFGMCQDCRERCAFHVS